MGLFGPKSAKLNGKAVGKPQGKHVSKAWSTQDKIIARQEQGRDGKGEPRPSPHNGRSRAKHRSATRIWDDPEWMER